MKDFADDERQMQRRKDRSFSSACIGFAVLFFAGLCGWYSLFIVLEGNMGGDITGSGTWSDDGPMLLFIAISPAYSFLKWMRVQ